MPATGHPTVKSLSLTAKTLPTLILFFMACLLGNPCTFTNTLAATTSSPQDTSQDLATLCFQHEHQLEDLPILQDGRLKPLLVHAKETMKHIMGTAKNPIASQLSYLQLYCLLSLQSLGDKSLLPLTTNVDHQKSKQLLHLAEGEVAIPLTALLEKTDMIRAEYMRLKFNDAYKKELGRLLSIAELFTEVRSGQNWTLPTFATGQDHPQWIPLTSAFTLPISAQEMLQGLAQMKIHLQQNEGDRYLLELHFEKAHIFQWAISLVLLSLSLLVLIKRTTPGLIATLLTLALQASGIAMRVLISGRAPITNMYETVLFSGFGALTISLIIWCMQREKIFLMVGLCYNLCTLLMINFAGSMLPSTISPLVPVLRDNFWLSTHVTCVILSYASFALSWVLSNMVILQKRFRPKNLSMQDITYYNSLIYTCLKFGVVLLSAGVILGGVWADYSWGRFWGWDPKETWSLIVLMVYVIILHGKSTSWIPPRRFFPLVAFAFLFVMMAWFGVNYILASGLHSYGFSEGGAIFLGMFFLGQILVLLLEIFPRKQGAKISN